MDNSLFIDIAGWIGAVVYLIAYALVSSQKTEGNSISYQVLNLIGGILLIINSTYYKAFPSVGVNIVWIGIAIYTLAAKRKST